MTNRERFVHFVVQFLSLYPHMDAIGPVKQALTLPMEVFTTKALMEDPMKAAWDYVMYFQCGKRPWWCPSGIKR